MNADPRKTYTADELKALQGKVQDIKEAENLTWGQLGSESGVNEKTMAAFATGKYEGDNQRVARDVNRWLQGRDEKKRTAAAVFAISPGFVSTKTSEKIQPALVYAQATGSISVITGPAGIGKTMMFRRYQATNPNVFLITASPNARNVYAVLNRLLAVFGITEKSPAKVEFAVGDHLKSLQNPLILVDEAHNLAFEGLEMLRSFVDCCETGVALAGAKSLNTMISALSGREGADQFYSRIGLRVRLQKSVAADVETVISSWGVTDADAVKLLRVIGGKRGHLRNLEKTMKLAAITAAGQGRPIGADDIRAAWAQLDPTIGE